MFLVRLLGESTWPSRGLGVPRTWTPENGSCRHGAARESQHGTPGPSRARHSEDSQNQEFPQIRRSRKHRSEASLTLCFPPDPGVCERACWGESPTEQISGWPWTFPHN